MKRSAKKHILIAVPAFGGVVTAAVASFTSLAMRYNSERGCPYKFSVSYLPDVRPTEYARNKLITFAYSNKQVDAIWFVDADMTPTANSFDLLKLWNKADIISGLCPVFSGNNLNRPSFHFNFYKYDPSEPAPQNFMPLPVTGNDPVKVDGAGTACMIIKRKVYANKKLWLAPKLINGVVPLFRWLKNAAGETTGTDDLDFCRRATKHGYRLWAHKGVQWGHMKQVDLNWMIHKLQAVARTSEICEKLPTLNDWNAVALEQRRLKRKGIPLQAVSQHPA